MRSTVGVDEDCFSDKKLPEDVRRVLDCFRAGEDGMIVESDFNRD